MFEKKLSQAQNDLYRELLDYANDKRRLDVPFRLMNDAVLKLTGLSETTMSDARNKLTQLGLIKYEKGKRNQDTPVYQIVNLYEDRGNNTLSSMDDTGVTSGNDTVGTSVDDTGTNLITTTQHNLTKDNNDQEDDNPFVSLINMYQTEIGIMSPTAKQMIFDSIGDFTKGGATDQQASDIIQYAIGIAVSYNKKYWNYVSRILDDWLNHSLFDLDNIKAYQKEPRHGNTNISNNSGREPEYELPY